MNAKRIICLILVAVLTLGLVAGAISMLVSAAGPTTEPTQSTAAVTTTDTGNAASEDVATVDGDKIIFLILGVGVPVVMFAVILVKVNRR